jgi:hypothetical protein
MPGSPEQAVGNPGLVLMVALLPEAAMVAPVALVQMR